MASDQGRNLTCFRCAHFQEREDVLGVTSVCGLTGDALLTERIAQDCAAYEQMEFSDVVGMEQIKAVP